MIRTLITGFAFMAALALTPVLADSHEYPDEGEGLEAVFDQLELRENKRAEVREILQQFREDRRKAQQALEELSKTLPPREEIRAMMAYSDTVLEYRLTDALTDSEVDVLMDYFDEQRRQREESERAMDNE